MIHDTIPLDFPDYVPEGGFRWFETRLKAVGALAALVLCNSAATRSDAERHFARLGRVPPMLTARLGATPLRPDPALIPPGLDLSRPFFVILGTIEPRKNHALLLDLWEGMARDGVRPPPRLLILGRRGWRNEPVFRRLDALKGSADVLELPDLPDGAVAALVSRARALLLPSHAEGFGLPAAEAAALGVPVLCNDLPVYREFLGDHPLALPVSRPDLWRAAVEAFATGAAPPRPAPPPLPTWEAHFAAVLSHLPGASAPPERPRHALPAAR